MDGRQFEFEKVSSYADWLRIRCLYRSAFPASERKPFSMIVRMWKKGKTDVWCFRRNSRFAGFATTINGDDMILIDYLAISKRMRGNGAGTLAIEAMKQKYADKGLFVEIESPYELGNDQQERIRRKGFYEKCGMKPMNVMANVFGVKMELLVWNGEIDFEGYHKFYKDNYSAWAAEHIVKAEHPEEQTHRD